jgi:formylglycine-generating enzyme required for sulfatase activity
MPPRGSLDGARIKILFLAASPGATARAQLDREVRRIEEKLRAARYRDAIELTLRWAVRPEDLQQALLEVEPHIVHFSGQGTQAEEILFEGDDGSAKPVSKAALAGLFGVLKDNVRVVVLNACHSRSQAEAITEHIDCAIGMQKAVDDDAAIAFSAAFYQALAFGRSLQKAFDLGRSAVELEGLAGPHTTAELVLRSGVRAGQITLVRPTEPPPPLSQPDLPSRRRSSRPEPSYPDAASRVLSEQLEAARTRRDELRKLGADAAEVDREILGMRRQLREGGRLRAGDALGDGRYRLLREVGRGGFGVVWEAHDCERSKRVAIKVLHPNIAGDVIRFERFFRGARAMAELEHEAIVRVLDRQGEDGGFHYFVMEFIDGDDLRRAVLAKRLPPDKVVPVILRVGEALSVAHGKGLIHRDVKPANILLDASDMPRLTDFDLVAAPDTTGGTKTGALGTILYTAPEATDRPQDADARADVYSLAMTAIFGLHGAELSILAIRNVEKLIDVLPCHEAVKAVLKKGADWDREARFKHAAAFCEELRRASQSAPRTPSPEPLQPLPRPSPAPPAPPKEPAAPAAGRERIYSVSPMVKLPGGSFWMGSADDDPDAYPEEKPRRRVEVPPFSIAVYVVTQRLYREVMGMNPSRPQSDELPVNYVNWFDAIGFCNRLSQAEGLQQSYARRDNEVIWLETVNGYRLPTEAEWEYAARAETEYAALLETETVYSFGSNEEDLDKVAWFDANARTIQPVGRKKPTSWGLYDMQGNVWEWCWDEVDPYSRESAKQQSSHYGWRVLRGGSYSDRAGELRFARRKPEQTSFRVAFVGFRVVRGPLPRRST